MSTYQGVRVSSSTAGTPTPGLEELSGGYKWRGHQDWYEGNPAYRDEPPIGRDPGPKERSIRRAAPRLGCAQLAALIELAGEDLTAPEVADRLGREHRSIHAVINSLEGGGFIDRRGQRRRKGIAVTVWGATTTGRAALAAHQQGAAS